MTADQITNDNAAPFSDSWAVFRKGPPRDFVGCEHNQEEAVTIADYLSTEKGYLYEVVHNRPDLVAAAKRFRPQPIRFKYREDAFKAMGRWHRAKK